MHTSNTYYEGSYTSSALPPGTYYVKFSPSLSGNSAAYLPEFYNDRSSLGQANPVSVTASKVTSGVNANLTAVVASFGASTGSHQESAGSVTLTLNLSTASNREVAVPYEVSGSSAGDGVDHTLLNGSFVFSPGQTSSSIAYNIIDDEIDELDETIVVTLLEAPYALLGANNVFTITIQDNDVAQAPLPAPILASITPSQGRSDIPNLVYVSGGNFAQGALAALVKSGTTTSLSTVWENDGTLRATVPSRLDVGSYDLQITNPDGKKAILSGAYYVTPSDADDLFSNNYGIWTDPKSLYERSETNLGLSIYRQGGVSSLTNVPVKFYLGNPSQGGELIGSSVAPTLEPNGWANTQSLSWTTPAEGTYTIFAVIDPDNIINETMETNNVTSRTVTVYAPESQAPDLEPPTVTSFSANGGAPHTTNRTITLNVSVSDPTPSSGLGSVLFIEYEFSEGLGQWIQVQMTEWLPYIPGAPYSLTLSYSPGAKYLQAWASDGAGNVAKIPKSTFINYLAASDTLAEKQSRYYVVPLTVGQPFSVTVTPTNGDPDLYVWTPDFYAREPWTSLASEGEDGVEFNAAVEGIYIVQVYGYSPATYHISFSNPSISQTDFADKVLSVDEISVEKTPVLEPALKPGIIPSDDRALPEAPKGAQGGEIFLPMVVR
jgi:hypothetical protein